MPKQDTPTTGPIKQRPFTPYKPRNMWKAKVIQAGDVIIKDYSSNSLFSKVYGRIALNWEEEALRRLDGLNGVPVFIERPSPYSLKMTALPGTPISTVAPSQITRAFIERLKRLFQEIHARGVAHGDAHMRNILIYHEMPYLVDFSTAYVLGRIPLLDNYIFKCFVSLDKERIYKVERKFSSSCSPPKMFFLYRMVKRR